MADEELKELDGLREEIDKIDEKLLDDIAERWRERMRIVEKIGAYKRKAGLAVTDKRREEGVIRDRVILGKSKHLPPEMVGTIWEAIIRSAKERE